MPSPAQQRQISELLSQLQLRKHHTPIKMTELLRAANSARLSASSDAWRVSNKLIRWVCHSPTLSGPLLSSINHALQTSQFPTEWKVAKIRALPKGTPNDFRPISLLNNLGKVVEKIVEKRVRQQVQLRLCPTQHGCRSMHSTQQAIN